jgi:hypothetical protein
MQIERRIAKLEEQIRAVAKPKAIEDMIEAMNRGDYGPVTVMSVVSSILSAGGNGDRLKGKSLPDELIDFFVETLKKDHDGK